MKSHTNPVIPPEARQDDFFVFACGRGENNLLVFRSWEKWFVVVVLDKPPTVAKLIGSWPHRGWALRAARQAARDLRLGDLEFVGSYQRRERPPLAK